MLTRLHVVEVELKKKISNFLVTRYVTGNVHFRKRQFHPCFSDEKIILTVLKFRSKANYEIIIEKKKDFPFTWPEISATRIDDKRDQKTCHPTP